MLLYRAAQIAAAEYAPASPKRSGASSSNTQTSVESRVHVQREGSSSRSKIENNDPRVKMAQAMGIEGDKLEKFKSQLGPYVATNRVPKMRSVGK
jgi:hypothetical protein